LLRFDMRQHARQAPWRRCSKRLKLKTIAEAEEACSNVHPFSPTIYRLTTTEPRSTIPSSKVASHETTIEPRPIDANAARSSVA
jgi:hypothetical protein